MWVKVSVYLGSRTIPVVLEPASFLENNSVSWGFDLKEKERGEKERGIFRLFFHQEASVFCKESWKLLFCESVIKERNHAHCPCFGSY